MTEHTEPEAAEFELTAGAICLDFCNTVERRDLPGETDLLAGYGSLVDWAGQAGLLTDAEAGALRRTATAHPRRAARVLRRAVELREAIFRLFTAAAGCSDPDPADLERFNGSVRRAAGHLEIRGTPEGPRWGWRLEADDLERVLWPVAWSAAELLTSDDLERVRECDASTCRWVFLDCSRNRSRRWCDMKVCGNRSKARRHYRKCRDVTPR